MCQQITVTLQVALLVPAVAVIFAVPAATAVTLPVLSTVATDVLSEDHTTVSVEPDGVTVAIKVSSNPSAKARLFVLRVMPVAGLGAETILTVALLLVKSSNFIKISGKPISSRLPTPTLSSSLNTDSPKAAPSLTLNFAVSSIPSKVISASEDSLS